MKTNVIYGIVSGAFLLAHSASAGTVPLDVTNYNFQLPGGGGGAQATLNGVPVEIFCDNFYNDVYVPSSNTADVTTLSTSANLDETRFGEVGASAFTSISLSDTGPTGTTDDSILNGANGAARYDMVAYLVSLYNVAADNTAANDEIQEAIWTLMDPTADGAVLNPNKVDPTSDLEAAAGWYATMSAPGNTGALNSFLGQFEVVSDSNMTFTNGLGVGGFQEQIVFTPAPEPSGSIWMLIGLFGVGGFLLQRARSRKLAPAALAQMAPSQVA
jgi:hypothetical protein